MITLLKHKKDFLKNIVKCPQCEKPEYYGHLTMRNGANYCRNCIYDLWEREGYTSAKHIEEVNAAKQNREPSYDKLKYWRPSDKDLVFPYYEDGINYFEREDEYING